MLLRDSEGGGLERKLEPVRHPLPNFLFHSLSLYLILCPLSVRFCLETHDMCPLQVCVCVSVCV